MSKKYNKQRLVNTLERITDNVSKRDIYVVSKNDDTYVIQNYISKAVIVNDIPLRYLADKLCATQNKGKTISNDLRIKLRVLINEYYKHKTDLVFYKNSMINEKDNFKFEILEARFCLSSKRYDLARIQLEEF